MSEKWPRARVAFLQIAVPVLLFGCALAARGVAEGEPAVITMALGGMSLSVTAALVVIERLYPGFEPRDRRYLLRAFLVSVVIFIGLLVLGVYTGRGVLAAAGVPAMVTGVYGMWLVLRSPA